MSSITSPTPFSPASIAAETLQRVASSKTEEAVGEAEGGGKADKIEQKDFFWDQFLTYMATIIALLTVLDATLQFFRGGGLSCRVPAAVVGNETVEPTRDEVSFVNTFCQQSLSRAEYYPFFVLIQGLLLAAPQYLWTNLFAGQFDFFFGLVKQLDRLPDSKTGQYRSRNFEIVDKLEKHFPQNWRILSIFSLYVIKLSIQFVVVFIAIIINGAVFQPKDFAFSFKCPRDFKVSSPPDGWWLSFDVTCVFTSFRLHQTIQNVNYLLLSFAFVAVLYGLIWCFTRHAKVLGYREIALFAFNSCLRPQDYVHPTFSFLTPRIINDLDFLLMRLFQADSGCGNVFKDIQIERELKKEVRRDHEYLFILLNAIKDSNRARMQQKKQANESAGSPQAASEHVGSGTDGAREGSPQAASKHVGSGTAGAREVDVSKDTSGKESVEDIKKKFQKAKFGENPGIHAMQWLGEGRLGNVQWSAVPGLSNFVYGFFKDAEPYRMALDISFGTIGYPLILSRAFQEVVSLNFHPFYINEEEICRKEEFHTNYSTITFREDVLSTRRESLRKVDEAMLPLYQKDRGNATENIRNNLVIIGPFTEEAKAATVNLFIERQQAAQRFDDGCLMLTVRPLMIADKDVSPHFCKLIPQANLFKPQPMDELKNKLKEDTATGGAVQYVTVGESEGIPMKCYKTECVFEILVYKFRGTVIKQQQFPTQIGVAAAKQIQPVAPPVRTSNRQKNAQHEEEHRVEQASIELEDGDQHEGTVI